MQQQRHLWLSYEPSANITELHVHLKTRSLSYERSANISWLHVHLKTRSLSYEPSANISGLHVHLKTAEHHGNAEFWEAIAITYLCLFLLKYMLAKGLNLQKHYRNKHCLQITHLHGEVFLQTLRYKSHLMLEVSIISLGVLSAWVQFPDMTQKEILLTDVSVPDISSLVNAWVWYLNAKHFNVGNFLA